MSLPVALTDSELLILLRENNNFAFEELYNRHWLSLYNVAYKRLKDEETCKDIVHDVFAWLWDKRHVHDIAHLLPYLHTAVRNKIYTLLSQGYSTAHFIEPFETMTLSHLKADSVLEENDLRQMVGLLIDTLPTKRRKIFRLRFLEERSTREISKLLNISQKTVQNQILNSVSMLRNNISKLLPVVLLLLFNGLLLTIT